MLRHHSLWKDSGIAELQKLLLFKAFRLLRALLRSSGTRLSRSWRSFATTKASMRQRPAVSTCGWDLAQFGPKPCQGPLPGLPHVAWASAHVAQFRGLAQIAALGRSHATSPLEAWDFLRTVLAADPEDGDGGLLRVLDYFRRGNAWGCFPFFFFDAHLLLFPRF